MQEQPPDRCLIELPQHRQRISRHSHLLSAQRCFSGRICSRTQAVMFESGMSQVSTFCCHVLVQDVFVVMVSDNPATQTYAKWRLARVRLRVKQRPQSPSAAARTCQMARLGLLCQLLVRQPQQPVSQRPVQQCRPALTEEYVFPSSQEWRSPDASLPQH